MEHGGDTKSATEQIFALLKKEGVLRPRDLEKHQIPRQYLSLLYRRGLLERTARGLYIAAHAELSEKQTIAEVSKRIPKGRICLLSALVVHEITTQSPFEVWIAIDKKARLPQVKDLPVRIVRFSGVALDEGFDYRNIDGVKVPVYNAAKTVADCFKYRNKIGLDVAIEALKDGWREKKFTMSELSKYAEVCRVKKVMQPYLESLAL
jgi:predicted transcriptional regulator of viral defense system